MTEPSSPPPVEPPAAENKQPKNGRFRTQWNRLSNSRIGSGVRLSYNWRRPIFFGLSASILVGRYYYSKYQKSKRDRIEQETFLVWRLYDGAIVEYPSNQTNLSMLLGSSAEGTEHPRIMTLYDVIRTLKFVEHDDRIIGVIADMSSTNAPSVNQNLPLGLAQIEELQNALCELKNTKESRLGAGKFRTVAFSETFHSQGEYTMASGFDEIYIQPTGEIPLVGINSTVTFYSRFLKWLGIQVHAEARTQYKSMVAPYTQEEFSEPQAENHLELLNDLNNNMLTAIATNRFASEVPPDADKSSSNKLLERMKVYAKRGPIMAKEAIELGLIDGTLYKEELLSKIIFGDNPLVLDEEDQEIQGKEKQEVLKQVLKTKTKSFHHYYKIMDHISEKQNEDRILNVGVVYVLGTIGDMGEFGTSAIVKGLHEAAEDDSVGAVVLRIDSGGGGVVESDTIWGAVKDLKAKGKVVIASFGNAAASGGYLIATHADGIFASQSTITGSIGVASLRPTIMPSFFDRLKLNTQSFFTGSSALSLYHELEGDQLARHKSHIDNAYQDFKDRVCEGRKISPELIEVLAGGRVYTGNSIWEINEQLIQQATEGNEDEKNITSGSSSKKVLMTVSDEGVNIEQSKLSPQSKKVLNPSTSAPESIVTNEEPKPSIGSRSLPTSIAINQSEMEEGPFGRGIIDGIGGIRDAAIKGAELYLNRLFQETTEQHPEKSSEEILKEVFPGVPYVPHENGEASLAFDIRLKKFPVHKTFWQQLSDASKREESDAPVGSLFSLMKQYFANWAAHTIVNQMESELINSLQIKRSELNELKDFTRMIRKKNNINSIQAQLSPHTTFH